MTTAHHGHHKEEEKPHKPAVKKTAEVSISIGAFNLIAFAAKAITEVEGRQVSNTAKRASAEELVSKYAEAAGVTALKNEIGLAVEIAMDRSKIGG